MNDHIYQRIGHNKRFKYLVHKRDVLAWTLSFITLALYVGFILLIAFEPEWLGTPIAEGSSITRGIPIGMGLIFISFLLTGIYVYKANREFDELTAQVMNEVHL
ncbi:MAG: DUF485 domain-containing protein [Enterobacteriaceae bacterium]|nr:DUF485 domain-containing protein [Enterobacteriaceae bacterium]